MVNFAKYLQVRLFAALLFALPIGAQQNSHVNYRTKTLAGAEVNIGTGQRPTLVAVFATWCTSCKGEFGTLDSLQRSFARKGVRVLALSVDEASDTVVRRYAAARHTLVDVAHDGSGAVSRTFGITGVPETVLVDRAGVIRWHGRGALAVDASLRKALAELR